MKIKVAVRPLEEGDFFWLKNYDCHPLNIERDSIYLFFCKHFASTSFVALDDKDKPIGFLLGFLPANRLDAYIHYLFVDDAFRSSAIGTNLVGAFSNIVKKQGAKRIILYTARASVFYSKLGFAVESNFFAEEIQNYLMTEKKVTTMSLYI